MAYARAGFHRANDASNGPTIWTYQTADAIGAVDGEGYFNAEAAKLKVGDLIYVMSGVGGSTAFGFVVVLSNTRDLTASTPVAGVVDTSNVTVLGAVDSD